MSWKETKADLNKMLDAFVEETGKLLDKSKDSIDGYKLNKKLDDVYLSIGKEVYKMVEDDTLNENDIKIMCEEAHEIIEKIEILGKSK